MSPEIEPVTINAKPNMNGSDVQAQDQDKPAAESRLNTVSIFGTLSNVVKIGTENAKSRVETLVIGASSVLPEAFLSTGNMEFLGRSANDNVLSAAVSGSERSQSQIDRYFQFRDNKPSGKSLIEENLQRRGHHENENGSSYDIDTRGDVTRLGMPPTEKFPKGLTYTAKYNDKHELIKLESSTGKVFTRVTSKNNDGFAYWECADVNGQKIPYGSVSGPFVGKIAIGEQGVQIMIGHDYQNPRQNTKWAGTLVERNMDGSETRASLIGENGKTVGFESVSSLADGSQVTSIYKFDERHCLIKQAAVEVFSADQDSRTVVQNGEKISSQENLLAKDRLRQLSSSLEQNPRLNNLRNVEVQNRGNNLHVVVDNFGATYQNSVRPGTIINGIRPTGLQMQQRMDFNVSHSNNTIKLDQINGMVGYGEKLGPLQLMWWSGSSEVKAVNLGPGYMQSGTAEGWAIVTAPYLTGEALNAVHPESLTQAGAMLDLLRENADHVAARKTSRRSFDLSVRPSKQLRAKLKESELPIQCSDCVLGKFSYDQAGSMLSGIEGIAFNGHNVSEIRTEPDKIGQLKFIIGYRDKSTGKNESFAISESHLKIAMNLSRARSSALAGR